MSVQKYSFVPTQPPKLTLFPQTCVVGIVTRPRAGRSGVRFSVQVIEFFLPKVQTSSGAQQAPYSMGTGVIFRGQSWSGFMFLTDFHLRPRLRMGGAVSLIPSIRLRGVTRTTLPSLHLKISSVAHEIWLSSTYATFEGSRPLGFYVLPDDK